MKFSLVNDRIKYKKGKNVQFLKDRKGFKKYDIDDGKTDLTNPYLHLNSLNRDQLDNQGWKILYDSY